MAINFPTTPILDSGVGSNEGPPPTGWGGGLKRVSNQIVANALFDFGYWNQTFGTNQEAYVTIATKPLASQSFELFVRQDSGNNDGYYLLCTNNAGTDTIELRKQVSGSTSSLATAFNQEFGIGDAIGITGIGSIISAYYKASGGAWILLGTATDTSFTSGFIALGIDDLTAAFTNFGGGTANRLARIERRLPRGSGSGIARGVV